MIGDIDSKSNVSMKMRYQPQISEKMGFFEMLHQTPGKSIDYCYIFVYQGLENVPPAAK